MLNNYQPWTGSRKSNESYVNNRLQVPIDSNHVNHALQILLLWQPWYEYNIHA